MTYFTTAEAEKGAEAALDRLSAAVYGRPPRRPKQSKPSRKAKRKQSKASRKANR